jgi:hypothetical protein
MRLLPSKGLAVIAMTNRGSAGLDLGHIADRVTRHQLGDRASDVLGHGYAEPGDVVGSYQGADRSTLTVATGAEGLLMAVDDEPHALLIYKGQSCFLKVAGTHSRYAIRLHRENGAVQGLCVGPLYFTKWPCSAAAPAAPLHAAIVGIYRSPAVGRVALFERNRQLILSYSPFKEAVLSQIEPTSFVQTTGPFTNERVAIDLERRTLRLGDLTFAATGEQY